MVLNRTVFAIGAHPDDIEFLMAGTLLLLREQGYEIHVMHLANGSCGTAQHDIETITRIRMGEAKEAAEILGAIYHSSLVEDLQLFYQAEMLSRVGSISDCFKLAEGWRKHHYAGFCEQDADPLMSSLGGFVHDG